MRGADGDERAGFGRHLADFGRAILADAREALDDPELTDAARVHELRKAFKRWRAWLGLLRGSMGGPAEEMRIKAREMMRALSGARDAQGALDAIDDIANVEMPLPPRTLAAIRERMTVLRDAADSSCLTADARAAIGNYLDEAAGTIDAWPVAEIGFDAVADALTRTFRRARQLAPDDWWAVEPEELHELRRRVVEHRHQMELVEPLWPRVARIWADEVQRLRNQLGACQDLSVLTTFVAPRQQLARWRSRLMPLITARRAAHLKSAARLSGRLFAEKPKAFHARTAALWAARQRQKTPKKKGRTGLPALPETSGGRDLRRSAASAPDARARSSDSPPSRPGRRRLPLS